MSLWNKIFGPPSAPAPTRTPQPPAAPQFSVPGVPVFDLEGLPALEEVAEKLGVKGAVTPDVTLAGVASLDDYEKGLKYLLELSKKKERIVNLVQKHAPGLIPPP